MEDAERELSERTQSAANPMVLSLIHSLGSAVVYPDQDNVCTNRKLWDAYATSWNRDEAWVQNMAKGSRPEGGAAELNCVGDEWSTRADLLEVISDFIMPYLYSDCVAAEIGSGGGRVAREVWRHCSRLICYDVSSKMLESCKAALLADGAEEGKVSFELLSESRLPATDAHFDFIYCFDALVHCDIHCYIRYLREVRRCLKPSGTALLSFANLTTQLGFERFDKQSRYTVGGFYFTSPEIVKFLVSKAGLKIIKEGPPENTTQNVYYNRDYLIVVQIAEGEEASAS